MAGAPSPRDAVPDRIGRYAILRELARGGMAQVFIALRDNAPEPCVLKRLLGELESHEIAEKRFFREARLAAYLDHPRIARVLDAGFEEDTFCIAIEHIAGSTIEDLTRATSRQGRMLPYELSLAVVLGALEGLEYAHDAVAPDGVPLELIHRDLSPRNLMLSFDGEVKIIDLGVARARVDDFRTEPGMIVGTLRYVSPEQAVAEPLDRRSDLYSLSVVLYELLSGRPLIPDGAPIEVLNDVLHRPTRPLSALNPELPAALDGVLARALAKNPEDRYPTARALRDAIEAAAGALGRASRDVLGDFVSRMFPAEHQSSLELLAYAEARYAAAHGDASAGHSRHTLTPPQRLSPWEVHTQAAPAPVAESPPPDAHDGHDAHDTAVRVVEGATVRRISGGPPGADSPTRPPSGEFTVREARRSDGAGAPAEVKPVPRAPSRALESLGELTLRAEGRTSLAAPSDLPPSIDRIPRAPSRLLRGVADDVERADGAPTWVPAADTLPPRDAEVLAHQLRATDEVAPTPVEDQVPTAVERVGAEATLLGGLADGGRQQVTHVLVPPAPLHPSSQALTHVFGASRARGDPAVARGALILSLVAVAVVAGTWFVLSAVTPSVRDAQPGAMAPAPRQLGAPPGAKLGAPPGAKLGAREGTRASSPAGPPGHAPGAVEVRAVGVAGASGGDAAPGAIGATPAASAVSSPTAVGGRRAAAREGGEAAPEVGRRGSTAARRTSRSSVRARAVRSAAAADPRKDPPRDPSPAEPPPPADDARARIDAVITRANKGRGAQPERAAALDALIAEASAWTLSTDEPRVRAAADKLERKLSSILDAP